MQMKEHPKAAPKSSSGMIPSVKVPIQSISTQITTKINNKILNLIIENSKCISNIISKTLDKIQIK